MMKPRSIQRALPLLGAFALGVTLVLYFQVDTSHPAHDDHHHMDSDFNSMMGQERQHWQEQIRSLRSELARMQDKQKTVLQNLNAAQGQAHAAVIPHEPVADKHHDPVVQHQPAPPATEKPPVKVEPAPPAKPVIAVLMLGCNRPDAIKRSMPQLLKHRPSAKQFPIIVSLDCGDAAAEAAVRQFGADVTLIKQPDLSPPDMSDVPVNRRRMSEGYTKISRHYKFALSHVFEKLKYESVIIVEDDLDISPDFFEYMAAGESLMARDRTIWCVSAWNDNGKQVNVDTDKPELLYRTDFFPGLGWMLKSDVWTELSPKWPRMFWDDWMRNPAQRKDRACIRPEVSRTYTFGLAGVSHGQFWRQHLQFIELNKKAVDFSQRKVDHLLKKNYDTVFMEEVRRSPDVQISMVPVSGAKSVRVTYTNNIDFKMKAKQLSIMDDLRAGVPRMAYLGVVSIMYKGQRVYLAPSEPWSGYLDK